MKKDKLKKYSICTGIVFFAVIAFLTYFSSTIDTMLLPKVKTTDVYAGSLTEDENRNPNISYYLLPISSVMGYGTKGSVYTIRPDENGDYVIRQISISITDQDDMYIEATSDSLYNGMQVVYSTSKDIEDGSRVIVEEG